MRATVDRDTLELPLIVYRFPREAGYALDRLMVYRMEPNVLATLLHDAGLALGAVPGIDSLAVMPTDRGRTDAGVLETERVVSELLNEALKLRSH